MATSTDDGAPVEARYLVHYVASDDAATYRGTHAVWVFSEAKAERARRACSWSRAACERADG
jgi:hypothetical protein